MTNCSNPSNLPRVLVILDSYLPGINGGGPITTISAMDQHLHSKLELFIMCKDRDFGDAEPYPNINTGSWTPVDNSQVMYLKASQLKWKTYKSVIHEIKPDFIYLNTVFSVSEVIIPLLVALFSKLKPKVIIAPRGCLDPGALSLKSKKKQAFLLLLKLSRLPKKMTWQASTDMERQFIVQSIGHVPIKVVQDLPLSQPSVLHDQLVKVPGSIKIIFLSRIARKKNLLYLIERLEGIQGKVELTIAGPIEDANYWQECLDALNKQPNIEFSQVGSVPHSAIHDLLSEHHIFALPTLGENFGHAIIEAFDAGLGVLISDRTPWRNLEQYGAGWDISLENTNEWETTLQECVDMDNETFQSMKLCARSIRDKFWNIDEIVDANLRLFGLENETR